MFGGFWGVRNLSKLETIVPSQRAYLPDVYATRSVAVPLPMFSLRIILSPTTVTVAEGQEHRYRCREKFLGTPVFGIAVTVSERKTRGINTLLIVTHTFTCVLLFALEVQVGIRPPQPTALELTRFPNDLCYASYCCGKDQTVLGSMDLNCAVALLVSKMHKPRF
eukprot:509010-Amphidinium_carterae.1